MATYANNRFLKARCGSSSENANHPKVLAIENDNSASVQVSKTELNWLVDMSHARLS
jgi:hypothetical protein